MISTRLQLGASTATARVGEDRVAMAGDPVELTARRDSVEIAWLSRLSNKGTVFALGALGLACALTSAALLSDPVPTRTRAAQLPNDEDVVARVDPEARAMSRAVGQLAAGDVRARVELAQRWILRAHKSADPRHLGRAQAALAPWWDRDDLPDQVRMLRASILQSLHNFPAARRDLDVLMMRRPEDVQLHLTRAAVATVTADYSAARANCAAVAALSTPLVGAACQAPIQLVTGQADTSYAALIALDAAAVDVSPAIGAWVATTLGELAAALGETASAEQHFRRALAIAPHAYTTVTLADLLLDSDRPAEVAALRDTDLDATADGLLLRLAIAAKRVGSADSIAMATMLRDRFAATTARGDFTHRREQGMFELDIEGRAELALDHLIANWELQKEPIDARLLLRAAAAARRPAAAATVQAWIQATGIRDHGIADTLRALAAALLVPSKDPS